jgi:glycerophosphoryl diester phosphodiesterase
MIEIKGIPTDSDFDPLIPAAEAVMDVLEGFPASQTIIQSFWPPALDRIEIRRPDIPTLLLTTSTLPGAPQGAGFLLAENIVYATLRGYEISAPQSDTPDLLPETVLAAHLLGKPVIVWTVNSTDERNKLASFGVDGIITDAPSTLTA